MSKRYFESFLNHVTVGQLISHFAWYEVNGGYDDSLELYVENGKIYFK